MFYEFLTKSGFRSPSSRIISYSCSSGCEALVFSRCVSCEELRPVLPEKYWEILFCTGGEVQADMLSGRCLELESGQILLLSESAYIKRAHVAGGRLSGVLLRMTAEAASIILDNARPLLGENVPDMQRVQNIMRSHRGCAVVDRFPWSMAVFDALHRLSEDELATYCTMKTAELMYLICRDASVLPLADNGKYFDSSQLEHARRAHDYMRENLSEPITIQSLSQHFKISPTALKESFRRVYGQPIHRYIRSVRLDRAAKLLTDTQLDIAEISGAVGYSSASQFTSAFKVRYGISPGQYRRSRKNV